MKIRVTMKDPDTLFDAVRDAVEKQVTADHPDLTRDERDLIIDRRCGEERKVAAKWFEYGEYVTIELDTEAGTAVVVPRE